MSGSPPERPSRGTRELLSRLRELRTRVQAQLRELAGRARRAMADVDARTRRVTAAVEARARHHWPLLRARALEARQELGDELHRLRAWLTPRGRRAAQAAQREWRRMGARTRRLGRELRRRSPSLRQALVLCLALFGAGWVLWERCGLEGCPDVDRLSSYQPEGASVLVDRSGVEFADLAPMEYEVVPLDSLPPYVADAFVAAEDKRFFRHGGVDWLRVPGAVWADLRARGFVQGSSTIPMQLSRTLFSGRIRREEKTLRRKLMEVRMAGEIEDRFTKDEILELYLNHVYLGGGSYGIQAASRYYFGKEARALELEEAAMLAALPKAPAHYDPRRHPEEARSRRDLVLSLMEEQELLSPDQAEAARATSLEPAAEPDRDRDGEQLAPYFVQHVRQLLEEELGEELYDRRLRVVTTLDVVAQRAAEEELEAQLRSVEQGAFGRLSGPEHRAAADPTADDIGYLQGAVVIVDLDGGVRAWVGGRDYDHSRYDRARLARRQAGSAFKPFVYGAALEAGFAPSQPIMDAPFHLARRGAPDWRPENYSGRFEGRMSMRQALVRSQNIPAVRLAAAVGDDRIRDLAERAGFTGAVPESPVAALGVTAVSPLEMTLAYASFAGGGFRPTPRFVLRVEDTDGEVLPGARPERVRVTDAATAFVLTDMLRDVVDYGTAAAVRRAGFRGAAAGKTGTTNDASDVWFAGYTPELVGTVWVGFDEVRPLPGRATGGGVAAPVWGRIMARIYADRPVPDWPSPPPGVVALWVDPETGIPLERGCRPHWGDARRELFLAGREPASACPDRGRRDLLGWLESVFDSRRSAPGIPGPIDPDLGVPRLPGSGAASRPPGQADQAAPGREYDRPGRARTRPDDHYRDERRRQEERAREDRRRQEERAREERSRRDERARENQRKIEEMLREARRRADERRREGG